MPRKKNNRKKIQAKKRADARAAELRNRPVNWRHLEPMPSMQPRMGLVHGMLAAQIAAEAMALSSIFKKELGDDH